MVSERHAAASRYMPFAWEVAPLKACSLALDWNQIVLGAVGTVPSPSAPPVSIGAYSVGYAPIASSSPSSSPPASWLG